MEKTEFIWMNGSMVKWDDAKVHLLTHALHYGSGAFEGIRFYMTPKGPAVFRLQEHIARLYRSFAVFGGEIPRPQEELEKAVTDVIRLNKVESGYIRPIVFYGYGQMGLSNLRECDVDVAVAVWPWGAYLGEGTVISVKVSDFIRLHPKSVVSEAKLSGYYVNSILSCLDVKKDGYDEALLLDYEGNIAEGPGENLFLVKGGALTTPVLKSILPGITRATIMKIAGDMGIDAKEKTLTLDDVLTADEAFYVGTAAEVTPIGKVNDTVINNGTLGTITEKIGTMYKDIVHGKNQEYQDWLTYVN